MNWKNMPISHKIATVISGIAILFWIICQIKPDFLPIDATCPAIAVYTLCEAVVYWKDKRKWAYLFIAAGVISLGCFILELVLL